MIPKDAKSLLNRLDKECEANETKKKKRVIYILVLCPCKTIINQTTYVKQILEIYQHM